MGAVYLAEHVVIEKHVALKLLAHEPSQRPEFVARFVQEARAVAVTSDDRSRDTRAPTPQSL